MKQRIPPSLINYENQMDDFFQEMAAKNGRVLEFQSSRKPLTASEAGNGASDVCGHVPAGSLCPWGSSPRAAEFTHKRNDGTFDNGPAQKQSRLRDWALAIVIFGLALITYGCMAMEATR